MVGDGLIGTARMELERIESERAVRVPGTS